MSKTKNTSKVLAILILIIFCLENPSILSIAESLTEFRLESEKYFISEGNAYIARIIPETAITEFTNCFNVEASKIHVYKDSSLKQELTTGYVMSGMYLTCDETEEKYELSVIGDLTHEGELDQVDLSLLIKHIVGIKKHQLTGIDAVSADLSGDKKIDQIDITRLIRYIVYHELDIPEIQRPAAPTIEVMNEEEKEKEWYNSDVTVKIGENETAGITIEKTIYKVSGTMIQEETQIKGEKTIKLVDEGEYKITAYSYSSEGAKSAVSTKTIKIDKTKPSLEIRTKEKSNSTTVTVNATDELSKVKEYTYYIGESDEKENITWKKIITTTKPEYTIGELKHDTDYYVKVQVMDNAKNKAEKQTKVHTDKIPELIDNKKQEESPTKEPNVIIEQSKENWINEDVIIKVKLIGEIDTEGKYNIEYSKSKENNWEKYTSEKGIKVEENAEIQICLTDGTNHGTGIKKSVTNIDKEKPTVTMKNTQKTSQSFTQTINVTDEISGLAKIKLYYKKSTEDSYKVKEENYQTINGNIAGEKDVSKNICIENLTEGSYDVYVVVTDVAGNITSTETNKQTVTLTTIAPGDNAITLTPSTTGWTNGEVTINATSTDNKHRIQMSTDGTNWEEKTSVTLSANATVSARLYDGVNAGEAASITIGNIDTTKPTITLKTKEITSKSLAVDLHFTDNISGLGTIKWYYKNSNSENYTEKVEEYAEINGIKAGELDIHKELAISNLETGMYEIYAIVIDVAGNETTTSIVTAELEKITSAKEAATLIPSTNNWTNESITITASNTDERYKIELSTNGTDYEEKNEVTLTQNGEVHARLTDGINVGESTKVVISNIDTTPAEATIQNTDTTSKSFTVQANITDNSSGLGKIDWYMRKQGEEEYQKQTKEYQTIKGATAGETNVIKDITYDNLTTGMYEIYAIVYDVAGNTVTVSQLEIELVPITSGVNGIETTSSNENYTNENVTITARKKDSKYTLQTSKDETNWGEQASIEYSQNGIFYARLTDGINYGKSTERNISNIDKEKPTVTMQNSQTTSKSFTQTINVVDGISGLAKIELYYKKSTETSYKVKEESYQTINGNIAGEKDFSKNICVENLTEGSYDVYVVVTDVAGNQKSTETSKQTVTLTTITPGDNAITLTPSTTSWTNGEVTVNATSTDSKYRIQMSTDGTEWEEKTSVTLSANGTVLARLYDGINAGESASITIGNIDTTKPTGVVQKATKTEKSMDIKVTTEDANSGIANITWYYQKVGETTVNNKSQSYKTVNGAEAGENKKEVTEKIENLAAGTYKVYAIITDVANNKTTTGEIQVILQKGILTDMYAEGKEDEKVRYDSLEEAIANSYDGAKLLIASDGFLNESVTIPAGRTVINNEYTIGLDDNAMIVEGTLNIGYVVKSGNEKPTSIEGDEIVRGKIIGTPQSINGGIIYDETLITNAAIQLDDYVNYPYKYENIETTHLTDTTKTAVATRDGWKVVINGEIKGERVVRIVTGGTPDLVTVNNEALKESNLEFEREAQGEYPAAYELISIREIGEKYYLPQYASECSIFGCDEAGFLEEQDACDAPIAINGSYYLVNATDKKQYIQITPSTNQRITTEEGTTGARPTVTLKNTLHVVKLWDEVKQIEYWEFID